MGFDPFFLVACAAEAAGNLRFLGNENGIGSNGVGAVFPLVFQTVNAHYGKSFILCFKTIGNGLIANSRVVQGAIDSVIQRVVT